MSTQKITEFGANKFLFDLTNSGEYLPREDFHIAWENKKEFLTDKENDILNRRYFGSATKLVSYKNLAEEYSLTPERIRQIIQHALKTLRSTPGISLFVYDGNHYINMKSESKEIIESTGKIPESLLNESITILNLSTRTYNALWRKNIQTIGELVDIPKSELVKIRNFGLWSLHEIMIKTHEFGIILK